jgi:membrane protease YdiL (CAAX protease family)
LSAPGSTQMTNRLQRFAAYHPYLFVLLLLALFALAVVAFPSGELALGITPRLSAFGAEFFGALLALLLLSALHWWRETGFARGLTGQGVKLYIVPIVFIGLPSLVQGVAGSIHTAVFDIALVALLIGFVEEAFFRGLIMRTLLPKGVLFSAIVSSVVFALMHLTNLLGDVPPAYVIGQLLVTFGMGLFLAALWLRTGSIWPLILLHAVRDFGGLVAIRVDPRSFLSTNYQSAIIGGSILSVLLIAYALFLLRPSQLGRLRAYYTPHLFPHPVPGAESGSEPVASGSASHEEVAAPPSTPPERLYDPRS